MGGGKRSQDWIWQSLTTGKVKRWRRHEISWRDWLRPAGHLPPTQLVQMPTSDGQMATDDISSQIYQLALIAAKYNSLAHTAYIHTAYIHTAYTHTAYTHTAYTHTAYTHTAYTHTHAHAHTHTHCAAGAYTWWRLYWKTFPIHA